jgi:hypothetical protein
MWKEGKEGRSDMEGRNEGRRTKGYERKGGKEGGGTR